MAARSRDSQRVLALDSSRGVAILLVMLSHFAMRFATESGQPNALRWPVIVGMIASPTFVLLSGAVYGTLSAPGRMNNDRLRNILVDRGIFLLLVAHALLAGSMLLRGVPGAWHRLYITDSIAPALMFGPAIAARTRPRVRLLIAAVLLMASWVILSMHSPTVRGSGGIVRELLFGTLLHGGESWWGFHWPLAEWFGIYLVGTVVGQRTAALQRSARAGAASEWLLSRGMMAATAGAALSLVWTLSTYAGLDGITRSPALQHMLSIESKFPPSPAYFLWFGGIGLCIIALMYRPAGNRILDSARRLVHPLGRSSLMLYIVSDYLFHVPFVIWKPHDTRMWVPTFIALLLPLYVTSVVWTQHEGNRVLTVGYPRTRFWQAVLAYARRTRRAIAGVSPWAGSDPTTVP